MIYKTIHSYLPKHLSQAKFANGVMASLRTVNIHYKIVKGKEYKIQVEVKFFEAAREVYNQYALHVTDEMKKYHQAIKVKILKNKIVDLESIFHALKKHNYLDIEKTQSSQKVIVTDDRLDYFVFKHVEIKNSLMLDGDWIYVRHFKNKNLWFLPLDFINIIEDFYTTQGVLFNKFIDFLDEQCAQSFEILEWKKFIENKKIFML